MPNLKSSKKQAKQSEKHRLINYARKSDVKTAVKKVLDAVAAKDLEQAQEMLRFAQAKLARARSKGLYHRNTIACKMSRLVQKIKEIKA